jgi:hypothetical protein
MSNQLSAEASAYVEQILDYRGATIFAFAHVEWFLAKIILEARAFDEYAGLDFSFSQDAEKRATVVKKILNVKGPFSPYADDLRKVIDDVLKYAELRNISAHGMMYRPDPNDTSLSSTLSFLMYRMLKGGKLEEIRRDFTLKEYTDEQAALTKAAREFQNIVRALWLELKLKQLDPE